MKSFLLIILTLIALSLDSISQEKDVFLILDFDRKTIDGDNTTVSEYWGWDTENIAIAADPDDISKTNKVFTWEKCTASQLHGGFVFVMSDGNAIDFTSWEHMAFRIRSSKPFNGVTYKFLKQHEIYVIDGEVNFDGNAETWHDVKIDISQVKPPHNNPVMLLIFPAGGEEINAQFWLDDLKLERNRLIPVSKISFNNSVLLLEKGAILQLNPKTEPKDANNLHLASWKSSNEDVVLVSSRGLISVVGKGEAIVTVDIAGVESSVHIISE